MSHTNVRAYSYNRLWLMHCIFIFSRGEREASEVIFGGFDPSFYTGNLSYADVIPKQSEWKVNLEG